MIAVAGIVAGALWLFRMPPLAQWQGTVPATVADLEAADWTAYGGDLSGRRYSPLAQIHGGNVGELQVAWQFRTGDRPELKKDPRNLPAFEATPLKIDDSLYFCTPTNVVISLDAETGKERWRFDPATDTRGHYLVTCRGVSYHRQEGQAGHCARRILTGTIDGRLLALDADDGKPCADFGRHGQVSLREGQEPIKPGFYSVTSPPTVVGGVAIVGGLVLDNQSVDVPSGVVRAYDVITGRLRWAWDAAREQNPVPAGQPYGRGSPNAWGVFSADPSLGLVFIPTGNRSPDYFGGHRSKAEDDHASAVVAIEIATGKTRWVFQTVHHDIWDYDVASQPVLVDMNFGGSPTPALVQPTKQGQIFVLDRRDGRPLYRVEERPVPQGPVPGDRASATQPFSVEMPSLHPLRIAEEDIWGLTPFDRAWCRTEFKKHRHEGLFTPPSLQGTVNYPSNLGASNWGSVAIDPWRKILIANTNRIASVVTMIPREEMNRRIAAGEFAHSPSEGTPYMADARPFLSPLGIPCTPPPWGVLTAIDLDKRTVLWQRPLGTTRDLAPLPIPLDWGVPNAGGSLMTGGGLVFIGAATDDYLRAFSVEGGGEIWRARLPAGGQATPMTYLGRNGRQYVVIAAGGHAHLGSTPGDYIVAFAIAPRDK